jgi:hypothetical protein
MQIEWTIWGVRCTFDLWCQHVVGYAPIISAIRMYAIERATCHPDPVSMVWAFRVNRNNFIIYSAYHYNFRHRHTSIESKIQPVVDIRYLPTVLADTPSLSALRAVAKPVFVLRYTTKIILPAQLGLSNFNASVHVTVICCKSY